MSHPCRNGRTSPPRDPEAIEVLSQAYFDSGHDIRSMLRVLFNSDFFKSESCWYEKVKSPAELVTGVLRLTETLDRPRRDTIAKRLCMEFMGQAAEQSPLGRGLGQRSGVDRYRGAGGEDELRFRGAGRHAGTPGSQALIRRLTADNGGTIKPERLVDVCLEHLGAISVQDETRSRLVEYAAERRRHPGKRS